MSALALGVRHRVCPAMGRTILGTQDKGDMDMIHVVEPWRLAKEFSRIISEWLTPEQLAEANRLNKTPEYTANNLCATHNYCDSNQAMIDALAAFGVEWDADNVDLCNAAWELAKSAGFSSHRPLAKGELIRILPEWQDAGDATLEWRVYEDEMDGRVGIFSPNPKLAIQPWQRVDSYMVERVECES